MARSDQPSTDGVRYINDIKQVFESGSPDKVLTIAPSLLAANFANIEGSLKRMMRAKCYWAHLDIMDGHFVPNITFGPPLVKCIRAVSPKLHLDAHLMISNPMKFLDPFVEAGADGITMHAETLEDIEDSVRAIKERGVRAGLSIKPGTPAELIEPVLEDLDLILVMTVEPGFGGQSLMPNTLSKVRGLARERERRGWKFLIQVDGGINVETAGLATAAGANVLVAGTAVFGGDKVAENIEALTDAALRMGG